MYELDEYELFEPTTTGSSDLITSCTGASSSSSGLTASVDSSSSSTAGATKSKKQRVHTYCPTNAEQKLLCEWASCGLVFNDMDKYLSHVNEHLEAACEDGYTCEWSGCDADEEFADESMFKRHVKFHAFHTKLKEKGAQVLALLREQSHGDTVKSESSKQHVPQCNLDDEGRNCIPELPLKFQCAWDTCVYTTDNPEHFYRHIKSSHVDNFSAKIKGTTCLWSECSQKLANKDRLREHIRHHSQEKLVACPNCGALFAVVSKFIDHCSRTSQIGNLCYQCSHCNKKFATNNLLKEHIRKHINKWKCPVCDMTCIDKNDLSKHILYKHTTHKAFNCSFCDHSSKSQLDLQKHIKLKHYDRVEYQCSQCEFKTKDCSNFSRHCLKFHLNNEAISESPFSSSYMCHVCNKVYCQGATLSKHLKKTHQFKWPSGHNKFRYKLDEDGYYRLQTLRYESIDLTNRDDESSSVIDSVPSTALSPQPPPAPAVPQQANQLNLTSMQLDLKDISLSEISGENNNNNHRIVDHHVATTTDTNTNSSDSVGTLFYNGMSFLNQSYQAVEIVDNLSHQLDTSATAGFTLTGHHHHHQVSNNHLFSTVLDDVNIF